MLMLRNGRSETLIRGCDSRNVSVLMSFFLGRGRCSTDARLLSPDPRPIVSSPDSIDRTVCGVLTLERGLSPVVFDVVDAAERTVARRVCPETLRACWGLRLMLLLSMDGRCGELSLAMDGAVLMVGLARGDDTMRRAAAAATAPVAAAAATAVAAAAGVFAPRLAGRTLAASTGWVVAALALGPRALIPVTC